MKPILSLAFTLALAANGLAADKGYAWEEPKGEHPVLTYDGRKVLEYVRPTFDPKDIPDAKRGAITNPTIKVFHHLYDASGKVRLTNGPDGQYPHHRGIFYGFNNISYDGMRADVWHCGKGESQRHVETLKHFANAESAGHQVKVAWHGQDGKPFATEERELRVRTAEGGRLIEFLSTLSTDRENVRLDGDPQHAGFHFRANAEVEKTKDQTYFLNPEGRKETGKETNWEKGKGGPINRPWTVMSFVIDGERYSVVYLDHTANPKEARQSERTYGRVGTYFEYDLTRERPLQVRYRLWVQKGEVTAAKCNQLSKEFERAARP